MDETMVNRAYLPHAFENALSPGKNAESLCGLNCLAAIVDA
jgi:hypothetical protein